MQDSRMREAHAVTFIEALLRAYLDFVEWRLPHGEGYKDNEVGDTNFEGMESYLAHAVAVFFASVTGQGLAPDEVLAGLDNFDGQVSRLLQDAWCNDYDQVCNRIEQAEENPPEQYCKFVYGRLWPDTTAAARKFVRCFMQPYLKRERHDA